MKNSINRREFLARTAMATLAVRSASSLRGQPDRPRSKMGLVTNVFTVRQRAAKTNKTMVDLNDPLNFLEECHRLGAGGMQFPLGVRDSSYLSQVRQKAEQYGMQVEAVLGFPRSCGDLDHFEKQVISAKTAGAAVAQMTMLPGRRYEQFKTLAEYQRACEQGLKSTEQYWATFPGRPRSAMDPMLKLARERGSAKQTLVSRLPQAQQLELERHNVEGSLNYAREKLKL